MGIRYSLFATVKYFRRMFLFLVISNVHAFGQNKGTGEFILEGKVIGRDTGSIVLGIKKETVRYLIIFINVLSSLKDFNAPVFNFFKFERRENESF